ncbi:MAG: TIGR01777 family oxidoreductase [Armatimonadetes bacterium]|nr:TIGR01777 family oxidoreductase [Armatimonadota bacterium]
MRIVVIGGTGFIGQAVLRECLMAWGRELQATVVTRRKEGAELFPVWQRPFVWDVGESPPPPPLVDGADVVINLAGETVAQRWTQAAKQRIRDSRVLTTRNLVESFRQAARPPKVLINASAVGYYGDRGDEELTEDSPPGTGFLAEVCQLWEEEAMKASEFGVRVVCARFGIVLGAGGGVIERMMPVFEWGLGAKIGNGKQWMPWVHVTDAAGLILHAITNEQIKGVMNVVSPNPVTNREFTRALARAVGKPAFLATTLSIPTFILRMQLGEGASVLTASQKVLPKVASATGYKFIQPNIEEALREVVHRRQLLSLAYASSS